jgi:hypothetical protein
MIRGIKNYLRVLGYGGFLSAVESKVTQSTVYFKLNRGGLQVSFQITNSFIGRLNIPASVP